MSKRTATELQAASTSTEHERRKAPRNSSGQQPERTQDDEMGEYEDGWEDEYDSEEEVVDSAAQEGDEGKCLNSSKDQSIM